MMKLLIGALFTVLVINCYGQSLDSTQFKHLYDTVTAVYKNNLESHLASGVESQLPGLSENASEDEKRARQALITARLSVEKVFLKEFFEKHYRHLSVDLSKYDINAKHYLIGYLDQAIRAQYPSVDKTFFTKVWKQLQ